MIGVPVKDRARLWVQLANVAMDNPNGWLTRTLQENYFPVRLIGRSAELDWHNAWWRILRNYVAHHKTIVKLISSSGAAVL